MRAILSFGIFATLTTACAEHASDESSTPPAFEAISLLGDTLWTPTPGDSAQLEMESLLDSARVNYLDDTTSADALIWLGRRTAYLGRYREAINLYSNGVSRFPDDARFLRHRGHRWISLREFDSAIVDFDKATQLIAGEPDEIEPDGLPNARNTPTSTLHSNIWYHLGLAHYLKGDFSAALVAYQQEAAIANNPDMLVATSWWRYLTLRRLGRRAEAESVLTSISAEMDVIENQSYHHLLLMSKGELDPGSLLSPAGSEGDPANAAASYGVGVWHLLEGEDAKADSMFIGLIARGPAAAFGVIAAEAELASPESRRSALAPEDQRLNINR
jgi:tetratricopeptide (TPR) repeat protein